MKRDPHISKLIRESGVIFAPDNFTAAVMDKVEAISEKKSYKPLIGRSGRIIIIFFLVAVVAIAIFYTVPSGELFGSKMMHPRVEQQLPQIHFNLEFLKQVNISKGVVSALVAVFVLIFFDARLNKHRLI